jgi:F0F1-type ATP synthase epsilon subunit
MKRQDASTGQITDDGKSQASGQPTMHIKVTSPFKTYFDETGASISAENDTGSFDILPKHHNFITLLNECDMTLQLADAKATTQTIHISGGLMHVKSDEVTVFLDV